MTSRPVALGEPGCYVPADPLLGPRLHSLASDSRRLPAASLPAAWDWRSVHIAAGPTGPFAGLPPPVRLD